MAEESLPRVLAQRYRLDAKIGAGGMGEVYRAHDLKNRQNVAVKLVRAEQGVLDEEIAGRFVREAKHTGGIHHENIIQFFEFGRGDNGDLFIVMELLEGESLSQRMRRVGKMGPELTVRIGVQICAALAVAHKKGLVHRDLKPANIMLVPKGGLDHVKVLDFGVAKATHPTEEPETQLTQMGMLVGTLEYMSPEQLMSAPLDGRADVYSLGVVLYRMLTATPPYRDAGAPAIIHSHLNLTPKSVKAIVPDIPAALDAVVMKCLAKRPDQRYATMEDLGRALAASVGSGAAIAVTYGEEDDDDEAATRVAPALIESFADSVPPIDSVPPTNEDSTKVIEGNPYAHLAAGGVVAAPRPMQATAPVPGRPLGPFGRPPPNGPGPGLQRAPEGWAAHNANAHGAHGQMPMGTGHANHVSQVSQQGMRPPSWSSPQVYAGHEVPPQPSVWQRFLAWAGIRRTP